MKKIVFIIISCFILTGCNKTMKCSLDTNNEIFKIKHSYKISYKDNNILKVSDDVSYIIKDKSLIENFSALLDISKNNFNNYGIKYEYKEDKNKLSLVSYYELSKLNDDVINEFVGTRSLNEYKKKLTDLGYKCR